MHPAAGTVPHHARILIVDDERHNRDVLEVMLTSEGFDLHTAVSGKDALDLIAREPPDLILLDVMMPDLDGYEVTARLKADHATQNIPVIIVTALDDREARMRGLTAGAADFLSKPVDRAELCARVKNLLRLKAYGDHYATYSEALEHEVSVRTADLLDRTKALEEHATALRRNEQRTNYALMAGHMGVWELDLQTHRMAWSETTASVFGLPPSAAPTTAAAFFELIHADDRQSVKTAVEQAGEGIDFESEFRVVWPDGGMHWVAGRACLLRDGDREATRLLGVCSDISDRKSLEAQFRQAQKMDAVGQLAGGMAHDFNNLLTAILGYSNFVLETFETDDSRRADLQEVVNAGQRAAALTGQLLAFSRKQLLQPTVVDLNALVSGIHGMLARLIGEQVNLVTVLSENLGTVRADHGQLEQVLVNLVVNARDALPGGGRLSIETANVELDQSFMREGRVEPGQYVMLAVSDDGIGMSEVTKQRLFEPFFTTKAAGKGTGLGLATVYGIVKQSGGYVWVDSEIGKGTSFKVYLPRVTEAADAAGDRGAADAAVTGTEAVLVVEDDPAVRLLTCKMLQAAGYTVFDAPDAGQAELLFERHKEQISLLLTDVIMPGSGGPALFAQLARHRRELKVLYVSGYTDDAFVHQGPDYGIEFLQKPFTADALNRRVRAVLDPR